MEFSAFVIEICCYEFKNKSLSKWSFDIIIIIVGPNVDRKNPLQSRIDCLFIYFPSHSDDPPTIEGILWRESERFLFNSKLFKYKNDMDKWTKNTPSQPQKLTHSIFTKLMIPWFFARPNVHRCECTLSMCFSFGYCSYFTIILLPSADLRFYIDAGYMCESARALSYVWNFFLHMKMMMMVHARPDHHHHKCETRAMCT